MRGRISFLPFFFQKPHVKLYWFIPDGMRADPDLFNIFKWANEGKLPNIKKLMDRGSYGYSYPNFPSHTPTNFATLLTGSYPEINGINDGPMRTLGKPLNSVAVGGFRSTSRKIPAVWNFLEEAGHKVALISIPGSTPPEIQKGLVIKGRWGGWGADFAAINFESDRGLGQRLNQGRSTRLFFFGPQLTQYIKASPAVGWSNPPKSYSAPLEININGWGGEFLGFIYDSSNDSKENYDRIAFSKNKINTFAVLGPGQWSQWEPILLKWTVDATTNDIQSNIKIAVVKIDSDGFFRIRVLYDNLNETVVFPGAAYSIIKSEMGPMVDFVDNFPPQLIYYDEDKKIFLDETNLSFSWHRRIISTVINKFSPDVIIHDIYTPNQVLTSRWWMGYIDPQSARYNMVSEIKRGVLWQEVKQIYKRLDGLVGEILKNTDQNSCIVLSSDHGNIPLDRNVNLNNLFAKKGWLKFKIDNKTGEPIIDWKNSYVIYLKMAHIYINPEGLSGDYIRSSGSKYDKLRNEVIRELLSLKDDGGEKPVSNIVRWEDVKELLHMDPDRSGDLVIANKPGYGWNEEMSQDLTVFTTPLITGYKQAIMSKGVPGMWTPFIIAGPGIKKNKNLGDIPFPLINQLPTIMKCLRVKIPDHTQGRSLPIFTDGR